MSAGDGRPHRLASLLATVLLAVLLGGAAHATPRVGTARPDLRLEDAWDRQVQLARYRGMPVLVLYEDKDSAQQNAALKAELSVLAAGDRYKKKIALFAIADLTGYDYWPVKGFVRDAIRSESHKQKTVIYCDWDGSARTTLGLQAGSSNVILYDAQGKVLFASSGALTAPRRAELIGLLRTQVEPQP